MILMICLLLFLEGGGTEGEDGSDDNGEVAAAMISCATMPFVGFVTKVPSSLGKVKDALR